ncbi:MAG: hypothetical protein QXU09_03465 [Thermoproteota archaeon]
MSVPILRRFTGTITATGQWVTMTDDETGLPFFDTTANVILDVVNDPDPAAGNRYVIALFSGSIDTGVRFYSTAMSPASAGRVAVGPIQLKGGQYQLKVMQTAGTAANYSIVVKFAKPFK